MAESSSLEKSDKVPLDVKDTEKDSAAGIGIEDVKGPGTRKWTTTRVELWAFYVFYIVIASLLALDCVR